jgi:D-alanine--poly(phosphoribitol) ligase subunit 2
MTNKEKLFKVLAELHPEIDYTSSTNLIEDGFLDSFDMVLLITELEKVFGVRIPGDEIRAENFKDIDTIILKFLKGI